MNLGAKRYFLVPEYEYLGKSILTEKNLKYNEKDGTVTRKHCHKHGQLSRPNMLQGKCCFLLV